MVLQRQVVVLHSASQLDAAWFKSSKSGPNCDNCVEVAYLDDVVGLRDSKDKAGPAFVLSKPSWRRFLDGVQAGNFTPGTAAA